MAKSMRRKVNEFEIGANIEGNYLGQGKWYPGKIGRYLGNGAYDVIWTDCSKSTVDKQYIRLRRDNSSNKRRITDNDMECSVLKSRKLNDDSGK